MDAQEYDISSMLVIPFSQFIAGVLLFIALLNGEYELALLTLLLFGLVAATKFWGRSSLTRLVPYSSVDARKLFPGDELKFSIHVENTTWLPVWLRIDITADGPFRPVESDIPFSRESSLLWYQQADFEWIITAQRRGVYQMGATKICAGDLFGFFPHERQLKELQQILVYPRLIPLASFPLPRHDVWGVPGIIHPIHDPVYLLGTRDYQYSQPAKHIHWKASARYNRLQEKLFESTSQEKVLLLLDVMQFAHHAADDAFEQTLEVLASLGLQFMEQGKTVGFVTNGRMEAGGAQTLPLSSGSHQAQTLLELLAQVSQDATGELSAILTRGVNLLWGVSCVQFSYCYDKTILVADQVFQQRRLPAVFVTCQPVSDSEEARKINIGGKIFRLEDLCLS
jgi:uncharacterized protein (DUF58 family)